MDTWAITRENSRMATHKAQWDLLLDRITATRSVSAAAKSVGIPRASVYARRSKDQTFRVKMAEALNKPVIPEPTKGPPERPATIPYDELSIRQRRLVRQLLTEPNRAEIPI